MDKLYKIDTSKLAKQGKIIIVPANSKKGKLIIGQTYTKKEAKQVANNIKREREQILAREVENEHKNRKEALKQKQYPKQEFSDETIFNLENLPLVPLYEILLKLDRRSLKFLCNNSRNVAKICKENRFQQQYNAIHPKRSILIENISFDTRTRDLEEFVTEIIQDPIYFYKMLDGVAIMTFENMDTAKNVINILDGRRLDGNILHLHLIDTVLNEDDIRILEIPLPEDDSDDSLEFIPVKRTLPQKYSIMNGYDSDSD